MSRLCQPYTISISSLYHLYTNSMEPMGYLRCTFGVPREILCPSLGAGSFYPKGSPNAASLLPHSTLAQKVVLNEGRAKQLLGNGKGIPCLLRGNNLPVLPLSLSLWQENKALPRAANSATRYYIHGTGASASVLCPPMWQTRKLRRSRPTAATSR